MPPGSCFLSYTGLALTNENLISGASSQSATLVIASDSTGFTNSSTLTVDSGGSMQVNILPCNNLVNGTLAGSTYNISGTMQFRPQGSITANAANITLEALLRK
jgi:hypothetical protein